MKTHDVIRDGPIAITHEGHPVMELSDFGDDPNGCQHVMVNLAAVPGRCLTDRDTAGRELDLLAEFDLPGRFIVYSHDNK